ncbi:MAG: NADH-quinone oxidoreductase subunit E [Bacteroidetes bacterium 4572_77]|nr:MAG: NADH-quinone oxidoreductase subunit E [Bacteroidetes bacterium 4572_77]
MRISRIRAEQEDVKATPEELFRLDPLIKKYKGKKGALIPILQGAQELFGYLPRKAFDKIAAETGLELSDMYGVATFYAQFRLAPVGKHIIKVCHGTACHVQNAKAITSALQDALGILDGETTEDNLFTLESVACLGCCSLAPVLMVGNDTYGNLDKKSATKVIKNIKLNEKKA